MSHMQQLRKVLPKLSQTLIFWTKTAPVQGVHKQYQEYTKLELTQAQTVPKQGPGMTQTKTVPKP